jgi:transposase-like protein
VVAEANKSSTAKKFNIDESTIRKWRSELTSSSKLKKFKKIKEETHKMLK